jgi:hypothetical protein
VLEAVGATAREARGRARCQARQAVCPGPLLWRDVEVSVLRG